jgi:hypothetical protein
MARVAHDTGVSICRPMYYEYPEEDAAYAARYQYFFGDQMIAAPIVQPADPDTGLAAADVWVPDGTWIEYTTKETFNGPGWVRLVGDLGRVPMLMKAGAILPLAAPLETLSPPHLSSGTTAAIPGDRLILSIFPGAAGRFRLYEDDGLSEAYREGHCEWTQIVARMEDPDTWEVRISPVEGQCDLLPRQRSFEIRLEGSRQPDRVLLNGVELHDWSYDPQALQTTIHAPALDKEQPVTVTALARDGISALGEAHSRQAILADARRLLGGKPLPGQDVEDFLDLALRSEFPGRADLIARLGGPLVRTIEFTAPEEASQQLGRVIVGAPSVPGQTFDLKVTWTLHQGQQPRQRVISFEGATESQIVDAPFAFDGQVKTMDWSVEVEVTWRGVKLVHTHQSAPLFPTIQAWQAIVYNKEEQPLTLEQVVEDMPAGEGGPAWKNYVQTAEALTNVNQPHAVFLSREYEQALKAGKPLAAYLRTIVVCPDDRDSVLRFRTAGPTTLYLNGQEIEEQPVEVEGWLPPPLHQAQGTAVIRLRPGRNVLLVHTSPPQGKRPPWYLGGWFATPDGDLMTDLEFTLEGSS